MGMTVIMPGSHSHRLGASALRGSMYVAAEQYNSNHAAPQPKQFDKITRGYTSDYLDLRIPDPFSKYCVRPTPPVLLYPEIQGLQNQLLMPHAAAAAGHTR